MLLLASLSGVSQATLIDRGAGMIYDDVLDITWLSDANPSGSVVNWFEASTWVDSLVYGGFDDWRLPSMDVNMDLDIVGCDVISETDCQDNELGYMFYYNLMGSLGDNLTGDQGLFTNIQSIYWSSTAALDPPDPGTWVFFFNGGNQLGSDPLFPVATWAVRPGDVLAVPEPGMLSMLGLSLAALGWSRVTRPART